MIYKSLSIKCYDNGAVLHNDMVKDHPDESPSPFAFTYFIFLMYIIYVYGGG